MFAAKQFAKQIFTIRTSQQFEELALVLFKHQAQHNAVYKQFLNYLAIDVTSVKSISQIPFLPIELFKTQTLITGNAAPQITFTSSGTTATNTSKHPVIDVDLYIESFSKGFEHFYGNIKDYCLLALLPSYLERKGSSLVYMCDHLIKASGHSDSGYYLHNYQALMQKLHQLIAQQQPTILLGVSYALWDIAEQFAMPLQNTIIMETGGMKGKRKELVRAELHAIFKTAFQVKSIHSEYGMTELLSQAYSNGNGLFTCPPWMKVLIREINDPLHINIPNKQTGAVNVIDLANIHSCAFLATSDLGKKHPNNTFEILGRMDASDTRGCNLLVDF